MAANDSERPDAASATMVLAAAQNIPDDSAMIGAILMHESRPSGGINAREYWGDAGPAQLTFKGVRNNPRIANLVVGGAYGNWTGRRTFQGIDPPWVGNAQDNIATLRNLVRYGRREYGSNYMTAYHYGPGYTRRGSRQVIATRTSQNRHNYAREISRMYNKYLEFFNCLAGIP